MKIQMRMAKGRYTKSEDTPDLVFCTHVKNN